MTERFTNLLEGRFGHKKSWLPFRPALGRWCCQLRRRPQTKKNGFQLENANCDTAEEVITIRCIIMILLQKSYDSVKQIDPVRKDLHFSPFGLWRGGAGVVHGWCRGGGGAAEGQWRGGRGWRGGSNARLNFNNVTRAWELVLPTCSQII